MKKMLFALATCALLAAPALAQVNAPIPVTAAGLTSTVVQLKASRGILQWSACGNVNGTPIFIQLFDTAGAVVVGTTPAKMFLPIGSPTSVAPIPAQFLNGIKAAATTTPDGSGAPATPLDCSFGIN